MKSKVFKLLPIFLMLMFLTSCEFMKFPTWDGTYSCETTYTSHVDYYDVTDHNSMIFDSFELSVEMQELEIIIDGLRHTGYEVDGDGNFSINDIEFSLLGLYGCKASISGSIDGNGNVSGSIVEQDVLGDGTVLTQRTGSLTGSRD